jgi:hypothetical protein
LYRTQKLQITKQNKSINESSVEFAVWFARFFNELQTNLEPMNCLPLTGPFLELIATQDFDMVKCSVQACLDICVEIALCDESDSEMAKLLTEMIDVIKPFLIRLDSNPKL